MTKTQLTTATEDLKRTTNEQLQYRRDGLKVFISAPFFSKKQVWKVKQVEKALEANPTVAQVYSPRLHQSGGGNRPFSPQWCDATYHSDLDNAIDADAIVEILDYDHDDTDSGTAYEMGYAKAFGKYITAISFDKYKQNLMLGVGGDYYFDNVRQVRDFDFYQKPRNSYHGDLH